MKTTITPYQSNIRPGWLGDFASREHILAGGIKLDPTAFSATDAVVVTVGAAGAAADAVSVPVDALTGPIPSGTVLDFGGKKFARLTAAAAAGAVTLDVAALATALADNDTATYAGAGTEKKYVQSGTLVGATNAELEAAHTDGLLWGPAADADDVVYLIAYDVPDVDDNNDANVVRKGTLVKVNFLPNWDTLSATLKGKVRTAYETTVGAPGQEVAATP